MNERQIGLQEAIDVLTEMLAQRVNDYVELKSKLPSFGPHADRELARYLHALENFVQGTVLWYYLSPRKAHQPLITSTVLFTIFHVQDTSVAWMSPTETIWSSPCLKPESVENPHPHTPTRVYSLSCVPITVYIFFPH